MPLTVATWNINSVRLRIGLLRQFLARYQPDVVLLQEIKCTNDQFPAKALARAGYPHQAVHGQKGYHGVAIISKLPLADVTRRRFFDVDDSRHVAARLAYCGQPITVHSFYIPAGGDLPDPEVNPKFRHKLGFLAELRSWFEGPDFRTGHLIGGDFNIAPHENDVWSHKQLLNVVSHTPVETEILNAIQAGGSGWVDLVRKHIPTEEKLYSWWSYRAIDWQASDRGRRLDHIWSTQDIARYSLGAEVVKPARGWTRRPSDHVPVIVRLA
ncbi:MAG TPA: exodeoxyribonuclease III [Devosiaceae bacterium]|nr:exodeoxyribonuclease III [Devosiaceae bacterium]